MFWGIQCVFLTSWGFHEEMLVSLLGACRWLKGAKRPYNMSHAFSPIIISPSILCRGCESVMSCARERGQVGSDLSITLPVLSCLQRTCSFGGFDLTNRSLHIGTNNSDPMVSRPQRESHGHFRALWLTWLEIT